MNELPDCFGYAEGGTRTPTPLRVQRPERCVSTSFTTSACLLTYLSILPGCLCLAGWVNWHYITVSLATCQEDSCPILELPAFSFILKGLPCYPHRKVFCMV